MLNEYTDYECCQLASEQKWERNFKN